MPSKRKRDILEGFDPNKSDSEDENFDPSEERPPRSAKKSRSSRPKAKSSRKRSNRYRGSDIEEDDEELSDSGNDESFGEDEDDEEEDEDLPVGATGRRMRKAAVKHQSYKESSEDEEEDVIKDSDGDEEEAEETTPKKQPSRPSRIVVLKTNPRVQRASKRGKDEPAPPAPPARRTRARTEEVEEPLVELSNSGRHAQPARASRSRSPESMARSTRATRGTKGLKKPPAPIEEATQETDPKEDVDQLMNSPDELALTKVEVEPGNQEEVDNAAQEEEVAEPAAMDDQREEPAQVEAPPAAEEDDDDDAPITRRTRASRANAVAASVEANEAEAEPETTRGGRRLRPRSGLRSKKNTQEPSSDFEPGDESGEDQMSGSEASKNGDAGGDGESTPTPRGRGRGSRAQSRRSRRNRQDSGDEEVELDKDEMAEELEELRESSRSRPRRTRRRSPSIQYEERISKKRRTKPVNYSIPAIDPAALEVEEDDDEPAATPARNRRAGKGVSNQAWERALNTTYGPFGGGGGAGALLGGPWGTGATGGVESDSSDDELAQRSGIGGALGMTPTAAAPSVGLFNPVGQTHNADGVGGIGGATPQVGKVKNQKAFADADPLGVDMSVDFSKVGGLQGHIDQLKEMVQLPLLYPELFLKFHVTPPRGVLFHGPPGTGKTLLARALANSVGSGGRKISFYMRKGADALSKWVGEAEKQLRLLFEEARRTQPSIIFFDEIDGLAPVRSSKQEQIHASIVSTLLALMDGMDGRGQVIVIGATNRPDNIDPALRRPGRFDREFYFPLPDFEARRSILDIHTKDWGLSDEFKNSLAENTKGYGGADLRALCTEAALNAIQRTYPQIYSSKEKLIVDPDRITIHATDFMFSIKKMIPSSERSTSSSASPLPRVVEPLLRNQYMAILRVLDNILPRPKKTTALEEAMYEPYEDADHGFGREAMHQEFERSRIFRPRLLISGVPGMGQNYLAAAILHHLEGVHVQTMDLATLLGDGRPMEQVIVSRFTEVKRHKPSVIFIPGVDIWWNSLTDSAITTFTTLLRSIPPSDPVLLMATADCTPEMLPPEILKELFGFSKKNRAVVERPERANRLEFFENIITHLRKTPNDFPDPVNRKKRIVEDLPVAPPPPPRTLTKEEIKAQRKADLHHLNLLKMRLQPIMDQINRKYRKFRQPVIPFSQIAYLFDEADPNFVRPDLAHGQHRPFEIAKDKEGTEGIRETATGKFFYNLETTTIEERLANGYYARPIDFYKDINRLYLDAKNIGDRDRTLKANELRTNVEVDVHDIAQSLATSGIKFEEIYHRQLQRAKEAEEKARKRKALQPMVDLIQSDIPGDGDSDSQGPVGIGLPLTRDMRTTTAARFQPIMSPQYNGHADTADSHCLTNGTSVPSRSGGEDVHMGGLEDGTQPMSGPRPDLVSPLQWPQLGRRPPLGDSSRATAGTQFSQRSAVTSIPPGVSPSAILNEASTTKTSELSTNRGSGNWSTQRTDTQRTNGLARNADEASQLLDTQRNTQELDQQYSGHSIRLSQSSSSGKEWAHSQAAAMAQGILQPRLGMAMPMGPPPGSGSASVRVSEDNIPSSSQRPPRKPSASSLGNILNEEPSNRTFSNNGSSASGPGAHTPNSGSGSSSGPGTTSARSGPHNNNNNNNSNPSLRQSGSSTGSQQPVIHEGSVYKFLQSLADRTSGCSVEQLEQIYRELMDEIWKTRDEWNRMTVLNRLISVFNDTIGDIELVQGALVDSQKQQRKKGGDGGEEGADGDGDVEGEGEVLESVEGVGLGAGSVLGGSQIQSQSQSQGKGSVEEPWVYLR
ncbi:AAA-domain-containing protein [Parathielavia appendiculata]|uniref:AAA-domain-containing protein n=1 Tax=Parathielavia appendiculata TaxID=2587402 RepID=A0AAN6TZE2_9PEZI|nr:AAA-domain-containing protein [Parathielavia appendiculata]